MNLSSYLDRIGFKGRPRVDLATLRRLQICHLEHIAYENLDVQFGQRVTLDPQNAFDKLVGSGRGGWCYEMNGLFRWALETIGFHVVPMTGAVMRAQRGPTAIGNHLVLTVDLEPTYLVDVGLGDGPREPILLEEGSHQQQWRALRIERLDDGWWRFHNDENAFATSFDFRREPADWDVLAEKCNWLQTSPESRFVQNAICFRHTPDAISALVGRVLKIFSQDGVTEKFVNSAAEYVETLSTTFGVRLPQAVDLWPAIVRRHQVLFGN